MESKTLLVTPEMAKTWLETTNKVNRGINRETVMRYAEDMKNGKWQLMPDGISFNPEGMLVNGQHRLSAIVLSGCSVVMNVSYNVEGDMFDTCRKRSLLDLYAFNGGKTNGCISGAVSLYYLYTRKSKNVPLSTKLDFLTRYNEQLEEAFKCVCRGSGNAIARKSNCLLACFLAIESGISYRSIGAFFEIVNSGYPINGFESSSAITFRNYLLKFNGRTGGSTSSKEIFESCCTLLFDFDKGKRRTRFAPNVRKEAEHFVELLLAKEAHRD